jgi:hypothetical protein
MPTLRRDVKLLLLTMPRKSEIAEGVVECQPDRSGFRARPVHLDTVWDGEGGLRLRCSPKAVGYKACSATSWT